MTEVERSDIVEAWEILGEEERVVVGLDKSARGNVCEVLQYLIATKSTWKAHDVEALRPGDLKYSQIYN